MTYKELLNQLSQLNEEQLNQDVAIWDEDNDEFYQQDVDLLFVDDTDVLDAGHPIIRFYWQPSPYKLPKFCLILMMKISPPKNNKQF